MQYKHYGIPSFGQYPLDTAKQINRACRCLSSVDETLRPGMISNIQEAASRLGIATDIKLTPLLESSGEKPTGVTVGGFEKNLDDRTKEDVVREHLLVNAPHYQMLHFSKDYLTSMRASDIEFVKFFYPNFTRMSMYSRLSSSLGGICKPGSCESMFEDELSNCRPPMTTDYDNPKNWEAIDSVDDDTITRICQVYYMAQSNWFKVDTSVDLNHVRYCLKLYCITSDIINNPKFNNDTLSDSDMDTLREWEKRVKYYYKLYTESDGDDTLLYMQFLYDLMWSYCDNPNDNASILPNTLSFIDNITAITNIVGPMTEANGSGEFMSKEMCNGYLANELGCDDDMYLLPSTSEYLVIDRASVKLAMDLIGSVDVCNREEYASNLNSKYKLFGCTYSISPDHPYAKYADQNIIDNMSMILAEAVDDEGTGTVDTECEVGDVFYKRVEYTGTKSITLMDNKELGPNTKSE